MLAPTRRGRGSLSQHCPGAGTGEAGQVRKGREGARKVSPEHRGGDRPGLESSYCLSMGFDAPHQSSGQQTGMILKIRENVLGLVKHEN